MTLGGQPYQIVARLVYTDALQERLHSVIGFTVNLAWVRQSYFSDILSQVAPIATRGNSLDIAVLDDSGRSESGDATAATPRSSANSRCCFSTRRSAWSRSDRIRPSGRGRFARASQPTLRSIGAAQGADEALLAAGAAALTLALGLILAIRAVRAGVALTAMRSDFVSSVTHELKTPLANIRAMADTLARRPIGGETVRDYAELLMQEAQAADAAGRQPARVCARHRRHRDVFVRADRAVRARGRRAAEFPASAVRARVQGRSRHARSICRSSEPIARR